MPSWARLLADGDKDTATHLGRLHRHYFATAPAPWWNRVRTRFDAERAAHTRYLADHGLGGLLNFLHPGLAWHRPVLELAGLGIDRDIHLDGRGLLVLPSYFCRRRPTLLKDPTRTAPDLRSLNAPLGRTRAEILETVAGGGVTTTELDGR